MGSTVRVLTLNRGHRDHRYGSRPIVADIQPLAIVANRQRLWMVAHGDGRGDGLGDGVDDRHSVVTVIGDVSALSVGTDPQISGQITDSDHRRLMGGGVDDGQRMLTDYVGVHAVRGNGDPQRRVPEVNRADTVVRQIDRQTECVS